MKIKLHDIYDDNHNLMVDNPLVNADDRLEFITDLSVDIDLIAEMSFGERELLKKFLQYDETEIYTYKLGTIHKAVYACLLEHLTEYVLLLKTDEKIKNYDPLKQFERVTVYGEQNETKTMGERVDTVEMGERSTTTNVGSSTDTVNSGERTATGSVTSFSSNTFNPTEKTETEQVTDSTVYGARTDTVLESANEDSRTKGEQVDETVKDTHTDRVSGYENGVEELEKVSNFRVNTVNKIVNDIVNSVTYGLYL